MSVPIPVDPHFLLSGDGRTFCTPVVFPQQGKQTVVIDASEAKTVAEKREMSNEAE